MNFGGGWVTNELTEAELDVDTLACTCCARMLVFTSLEIPVRLDEVMVPRATCSRVRFFASFEMLSISVSRAATFSVS